MEIIDEEILNAYGLSSDAVSVQKIGSGHINRTYLVSALLNNKKHILQEINTAVFKSPEIIAANIAAVAAYLQLHVPEYLFPAPVLTVDGLQMVHVDGTYWRLMPYVYDSVALDTLFEPQQAYEAARQFAKLSRLLSNFPADMLQPTIPGFHNLNLRVNQFNSALKKAPEALKVTAAHLITKANHHLFIADYYNSFLKRTDFPDRVMHHDTKISNVLLEKETFKGICVIDLDTLMPGKFISDLGDMMRTYLCAFDENETDLDKITIRIPYFKALMEGYLSEMKNMLTNTEKELILFSGKYIIYMQALRFLTDYLNGSVYYPTAYAGQNLDRSMNQFKLLSELQDNEPILQDIIDQLI